MSNIVPNENDVFSLVLPQVSSNLMLSSDGLYPSKWEYSGEELSRGLTGQFKLVRSSYCSTFREVRLRLGPDRIPEGQWREAFRKSYPIASYGDFHIGFADPAWKGPRNEKYFPVLYQPQKSKAAWEGGFHSIENIPFRHHWLWLVKA